MALWPHLSSLASEKASLRTRGSSERILHSGSPPEAKLQPPLDEEMGKHFLPSHAVCTSRSGEQRSPSLPPSCISAGGAVCSPSQGGASAAGQVSRRGRSLC